MVLSISHIQALGCPENKLLLTQHLPHLGSRCLPEGGDTVKVPRPTRAASALANKPLAALRNSRGFIRYLHDTHLAVGVAERLRGLFVPLLQAAREEILLSTIQAAAYAHGPGTVMPGGRR